MTDQQQTTIFDVLDSHRARVFEKVSKEPGHFREDFAPWLDRNWNVWYRFETQAAAVLKRRRHYASRTIIEYLRHETALAEVDGEYKLNNNYIGDVSRLFMMLHDCPGFFETRLPPNAARVL